MLSTQAKIAIALLLAVIAVIGFLWQLANLRVIRSRGRRRNRNDADKATPRKSDVRKLKGTEKRLYLESQRLLAEGKVAPAARVLEQLNMPREAIQALEDHGLIHEAAKILMRMQRHNRAGVVYARHGMWENAAQCFKMANMPVEVAKCAREAGHIEVAAEYFEKGNRLEEAAECYEQIGALQRAGQLFAAAGNQQKSIAVYNRLISSAEDMTTIKLDESEVNQIVRYVSDGHVDTALAKYVARSHRLPEVVLVLLSKGEIKPASDMLTLSPSDIGPMLMAEVSYQTEAAAALAQAFYTTSQFQYAGMVYERMMAFERAAEAFEKFGDLERASYCYERGGNSPKAKALKDASRRSGEAPQRSSGYGHASEFALADVQTAENRVPLGDSTTKVFVSSLANEEGELAQASERTAIVKIAEHQAGDSSTEPAQPLEQSESVQSLPPPPIALVPPRARVNPLDDGRERSAFHRAAFFADLDDGQKDKLWSIGRTIEFREGDTILTYNDEPKGVYVIVEGTISCFRTTNGQEAYVDQMGQSESFGELWLLADQPTAVRFVAAAATKIRVIDRSGFNELLDRDGVIARKLYKRFTMRLIRRLLKPAPVASAVGAPVAGPAPGQQAS